MQNKNPLLILLMLMCSVTIVTAQQPEFSIAGFYQIENSGRKAYSMNVAWRFHKGSVANAESVELDDSRWPVVSLPHGTELLPTEASGCINYQGETWYRKRFTLNPELKGKQLMLHFEGIMGKSKIYINGKLVKEHFGGYLPSITDITKHINPESENIIAVLADNSNDPAYPPGKAQEVLDFTYFGGIYRDCWLIAYNSVHITDSNYENETAGGGLFVSYSNVSEESADILLQSHIRNESMQPFIGTVEYEILNKEGKRVERIRGKIEIPSQAAITQNSKTTIKKPTLWSPDEPNLYNLFVRIYDKKGNIVDGYKRRIGIRSIEFKGSEGFWLNGKPYETPLIGANRHQDFALIGHALPNSLHWRDAKKLRDAGLKVIRNAHYPQDPAFMDACDELGLFVIVNTPGWQFWSNEPQFAKLVYSDIRNMVRRDRNHPCVWMWEPILNETWYPEDFAKNARDIVDEEYPYPYCYSGCDNTAKGFEHFPVRFSHPTNGDAGWGVENADPNITYFTREWGDNVDDWSSHNSPSRVARNWGEEPMLVQSRHYANPPYPYTCYNTLFSTSRNHVGGTLWHAFDHQRGYHPDPFYGGIMDAYRQPKYSYYMFKAQRSPEKVKRIYETGPMVYIANEMTPFSSKDVTVYSNCDEVRLTYNKEGKVFNYKKEKKTEGMPSPVIIFENVYDFMIDKGLARSKKQNESYLLAEGIIDGKVVTSHKVMPTRRPSKIMLTLDNEGTFLTADGSDIVTLVAAITDNEGNIKHLNNYQVKFEIEGEGNILGSQQQMVNPTAVRWGTAPVLIQSTLNSGKIKVTASVLFEGSQMPASTTIEFESIPTQYKQIYNKKEAELIAHSQKETSNTKDDNANTNLSKEEIKVMMQEVEKQQTEFGENR